MDGRRQDGEAWVRVDQTARTMEWGSDGPRRDRGRRSVTAEGDPTAVEITIETDSVHDTAVDTAIGTTSDPLRLLLEAGTVPGP